MALDYRHRGWSVIPVKYRGKQPIGSAWQKQRLDEDGLREAFAVPRNIGVLLGEPSNGLVDVDLDCRRGTQRRSPLASSHRPLRSPQ